MAGREKPSTQREMLDQLWYAVLGTNGEGMMERLDRVERKLNEVPPKQKKPRRLEVLTTVIAALTLANMVGLFDSIRQAIFQWLQSGGA